MRIDNKQISSLSEVATRFPKSYAKISAAFGQDARQFFQAFDVDTAQVSTANRLLRELIDAAPNGGDESAAHVAWRAEIVSLEALLTRIAGADINPGTRSGAITLLSSLLTLAQSGSEAAWRAALANLPAVVAAAGSTVDQSTAGQIKARIARARLRANLPAGASSILQALTVPPEPPSDAQFTAALAAAKLFFRSDAA